MKERGWKSLRQAEIVFSNWCQAQLIPLQKVSFVATFESWDRGIVELVFGFF